MKNNVPSNFVKYVCALNFFCATFYLNSSEFGMTCMIYAQKHFWKEHLYYMCSKFSCVRSSHHLQLRGNIDEEYGL